MKDINAMFTQAGTFIYQVRHRGEQLEDRHQGVRLHYPLPSLTREGALSALAGTLADEEGGWIRPIGAASGLWQLDLSQLRQRFPEALRSQTWLEGVRLIEPQYDQVESVKGSRSGTVTFTISRESPSSAAEPVLSGRDSALQGNGVRGHVEMRPKVTFEEIDPADLESAVMAQPVPVGRKVVNLPPLGAGHQLLLTWALADIEEARLSALSEQPRHSANAVVNARRALGCLIDEYLRRDALVFCKGLPSAAEDRAAVILDRGILDLLANRTLRRAVEKRNLVEHQYESVTLEEAEDRVQLIRATIDSAVVASPPYLASVLLGSVLGGIATSLAGQRAWFGGWSGVALVIVRERDPWFGIVLPQSDEEAVVRRVRLAEVPWQAFRTILKYSESVTNSSFSGLTPDEWHTQLVAYGLEK